MRKAVAEQRHMDVKYKRYLNLLKNQYIKQDQHY